MIFIRFSVWGGLYVKMMKTAPFDSGDTELEVVWRTLENNSSFGSYKVICKNKWCLGVNEMDISLSLSLSLTHTHTHTHRVCNLREHTTRKSTSPKYTLLMLSKLFRTWLGAWEVHMRRCTLICSFLFPSETTSLIIFNFYSRS